MSPLQKVFKHKGHNVHKGLKMKAFPSCPFVAFVFRWFLQCSHPYKTLINQSLAVSATSKESQELLRKSMQLLSKEEYVHILMDASLCLRYEPDYKITQPLLLMIGDKEATGNIRKAMPLWAKHDGVELVVIPKAKHAANLDQPEKFHKYLLDFLQHLEK